MREPRDCGWPVREISETTWRTAKMFSAATRARVTSRDSCATRAHRECRREGSARVRASVETSCTSDVETRGIGRFSESRAEDCRAQDGSPVPKSAMKADSGAERERVSRIAMKGSLSSEGRVSRMAQKSAASAGPF